MIHNHKLTELDILICHLKTRLKVSCADQFWAVVFQLLVCRCTIHASWFNTWWHMLEWQLRLENWNWNTFNTFKVFPRTPHNNFMLLSVMFLESATKGRNKYKLLSRVYVLLRHKNTHT